MRQSGGAEHQKEGARNALRAKGKGDGRCSEQRDTKARPLGHHNGEPPWAAVANAQSRRGNQKLRERRTGTTTHQETTGQAHKRQQAGSQAQEESPRQGLDVQIQVGREVRHGPAGAYLPCAASPHLQCDARVQPVENDFSRGDVAFARDGFAERAQNGQRVGVRSPIGTPHNRGVGDVLAICLPMQCLTLGSRSPFQDIMQNLLIRGPLCARD